MAADDFGDLNFLLDDDAINDYDDPIIGAWTQTVGSGSQEIDLAAANFVGDLEWSSDEEEGKADEVVERVVLHDVEDDPDLTGKEIPVNDYGQKSDRWLKFLTDFTSAGIYDKRINHFFWYGEQNNYDFAHTSHDQLVLRYFEEMHEKKKPDGTTHYRGTVQRGGSVCSEGLAICSSW